MERLTYRDKDGFPTADVAPVVRYQRIIMEKLKAYGVKCYRWDPDTGLTEI